MWKPNKKHMAKRDSFVSYILDTLQDFGLVKAKRMFGGYGIYRGEIIFAIVVDGVLYIKADNENRTLFEKNGLYQFSYMKKGKECFMSYYAVPEEFLARTIHEFHHALACSFARNEYLISRPYA